MYLTSLEFELILCLSANFACVDFCFIILQNFKNSRSNESSKKQQSHANFHFLRGLNMHLISFVKRSKGINSVQYIIERNANVTLGCISAADM